MALRFARTLLALAVPLVGLTWPVAAERGLVDWVAQDEISSPGAAVARIASSPGCVSVTWRPLGAARWAGDACQWTPSGGGLVAHATGDGPFGPSLRVARWRGALRLKLTLRATRPVGAPTEVVVACRFEPSAWRHQFIPRLPYLQLAPDAPAALRFAASADDATTVADAPWTAFYPLGVLENDNGFVLWGSSDVGRFAVISPNAIERSSPCFTLRPKCLSTGQSLTFDIVLKCFARPECRYRDVLRWYLRAAESSDPLVRDLFPWDGRRRARPLGVGNLGSGLGRISDPGLKPDQVRELLRSRRVSALWFQGWGPWDETYPTEGEWYTEYWARLSAAQVRDEIAWERANGIAPYLYCRQFLTEQGVHDDRPPLREWLGRDENGNRQAWGDWPVPEAVAQEIGFSVLQQSCADFGNPGYLAWYEGRVKACIESYRPAGIAWDMGWGAGNTWGYSTASPQTPNGDGMLRAQADLWKWLDAEHPEMRAISNEAFGTPSQLFCDGILIEGGFAAGKTDLDYEAAKAVGTTIISYEYPTQYAAQLKGLPTSEARYVQMRYRAIGVNTKSDRYVVYPSQEVVGKEGPAIACSDLQADGEWHVATFDMGGLPNIEEIRGMAFGLDSAAEEARLWVEYIRFSGTPDGPALAGAPGGFPSEITAADAPSFDPRPTWVLNGPEEHGVRRDGDTIEFTVRGAGKGMSWSFFPARAELAQEYLHVVGLGACLGAGLRTEYAKLNGFSAQAMALPLLVGSHDVEVTPAPALVTASAWGGGGRLLVAAHNPGDTRQSVTIEVARGALREARVGQVSGGTSLVMAADAEQSHPGPEPRITADGALRFRVRLGPGEALLWGNWRWEQPRQPYARTTSTQRPGPA